ncbi:CoA-transferase family III [Sphingomonas sp. YR710]|uniref:CoA transferase n=1 Tax=Sphingomonas sp. YR710 TaxID=1882773 RepID=UPI00088FFF7B|nr:CoA transferase [Sphingomonas sp. YR710]SDC53542.1 CoA-transferase family III [Sphingomonas sp. YR710]
MPLFDIPLAASADKGIRRLAGATGASALAALDGNTLIGERAVLAGMTIAGRRSAGGGCTLFDAIGGAVALNLARPADRELLPALFASDALDPEDETAIAAHVGRCDGAALVERGRSMGLAMAFEYETNAPACPISRLADGVRAVPASRQPRIIDLSALWAGPLAAHLLWLAGADVVKVESRTRPDAMRDGDAAFFALLNQGKASVAIDLGDPRDRAALRAMIAAADIVIEAARPRALAQLGIDAAAIVRATPGLVWITITGHGATGEAADWVGFGDDCGVAAGLSAALHSACGQTGFVGDAIADPLTGIAAAEFAWEAWSKGDGGRYGVAMRHVVAGHLADAQASDPIELATTLSAWNAAQGQPFPEVVRRPARPARPFGADTHFRLAAVASC